MSTPISELGGDQVQESGGTGIFATAESAIRQYRPYIVLLVVAVAVLKIPVANLRSVLPRWALSFGEAPAQAFLIVAAYFIATNIQELLPATRKV